MGREKKGKRDKERGGNDLPQNKKRTPKKKHIGDVNNLSSLIKSVGARFCFGSCLCGGVVLEFEIFFPGASELQLKKKAFFHFGYETTKN